MHTLLPLLQALQGLLQLIITKLNMVGAVYVFAGISTINIAVDGAATRYREVVVWCNGIAGG